MFSRALSSDARAAVTIAVGLTLGKLALLTAAVLGVTAAAATLGPLFVALKLAGGGYLVRERSAAVWLSGQGRDAGREVRDVPQSWAWRAEVEVDGADDPPIAEHQVVRREVVVANDIGRDLRRRLPDSAVAAEPGPSAPGLPVASCTAPA